MSSHQLYTIGYQAITPARLEEIVRGLDAVLIDCRYRPVSRKPGFGHLQLCDRFPPDRYVSKGFMLGGIRSGVSHTNRAGIQFVTQSLWKGNVILMCLEACPGECHRHELICRSHFPEALHIFEDELITARELQRSIDADDDYAIAGSLSDLLA